MKSVVLGNGHSVADQDRKFVYYLQRVYTLNQESAQQKHWTLDSKSRDLIGFIMAVVAHRVHGNFVYSMVSISTGPVKRSLLLQTHY